MFFQSAAALMFEVSLSRLLSIELWHHYAFLIISGALLGYGSAGSFRLLFRRPIAPFIPSLAFAVGLLPLFVLANHLPLDPALLPLDPWHGGWLLLHFLLLALPFFLAGLTLNLLLERHPDHAFALYSSDLLGAALGGICFFLVASHFEELEWLALAALLGMTGAACLAPGQNSRMLVGGAVLGLLLIWKSEGLPSLKINDYKALPLALQPPKSKIIATQRDAASRLDWLETPLARYAPGLSLDYLGPLPPQLGLTLDGDGLIGYAPWRPESLGEYLRHLPTWWLFYEIPPPDSVLVLQALGGQEVLSALEAQATSVTMQTALSLLAEELLRQNTFPQVTVHAEQARTLLARTSDHYDRILVSIESAMPVGSTGMAPLRKDELATLEGYDALLDHLAQSGWLAVQRTLLPPPRAEFRLIATVIAVLEKRGWTAKEHLGVFRTLSTLMLVVSREPWSSETQERFRKFCRSRGYAPVYFPGMSADKKNQGIRLPEPVYATGVQQLLEDSDRFYQTFAFDLEPLPEDRPYFNLFLKWSKLSEIYAGLGRKPEGVIEAGLLVPLLFGAVSVLGFLLIGTPLLLHRRIVRQMLPGMAYFFAIGLAFMLAEIALLERLTPFLGQPVYALTVVLCGLLLASGLGAGWGRTQKFPRVAKTLGGLLGLLLLYFFGLGNVLTAWAGLEATPRLLVALAAVALPGFLMGVPFPVGLTRLVGNDLLAKQQTTVRPELVEACPEPSRRGQAAGLRQAQPERKSMIESSEAEARRIRVALAWCCNGCASVMGATGAIWLAQLSGQSSLFLAATVCYGLAFLMLNKLSR
jgi:hypothetical protein